jgi:hypothetical protein
VVVRAFVLYDEEPDAERYARHVALCIGVEGATFRHGRIFGSPGGEPRYRYYAEWEFPDREAFRAASRTPEFAATAKDAEEMGGRFEVFFADVDG